MDVSLISTLKSRAVLFLLCTLSLLLTAPVLVAEAWTAKTNETVRVNFQSGSIIPGTCSGGGGAAGWAGGKSDNGTITYPPGSIPVGSYTYNFSCQSDFASSQLGAWITASDVLTMTNPSLVRVAASRPGDPNPLAFTPTLSLNTSSTYVYRNGTFSLSWNYSDPYGSCVSSGSWTGSRPAQGSAVISWSNGATSDVDRPYSLSCTSPGKSPITRSVSVTHQAKISGGGGCFVAGTKVTMADGSVRDIETVREGERIMTSFGGEVVERAWHIPYSGNLYAFNGSGNYFVTDSHPFMTLGGWKSFNPGLSMKENPGLSVSLLKVGDTLIKKNGAMEKLERVDVIHGEETVYSFRIGGRADFYADEYWVHNKIAAEP